jgi:hypothetical protein
MLACFALAIFPPATIAAGNILKSVEMYSWRWSSITVHSYTPLQFIRNVKAGKFSFKVTIRNRLVLEKLAVAVGNQEIKPFNTDDLNNTNRYPNMLTRAVVFFNYQDKTQFAMAIATDAHAKLFAIWLTDTMEKIKTNDIFGILAEYIPSYEFMPNSYDNGLHPPDRKGENVYTFKNVEICLENKRSVCGDTIFFNNITVDLKSKIKFPPPCQYIECGAQDIECRLEYNASSYLLSIARNGKIAFIPSSNIKVPNSLKRALFALLPIKYSPEFKWHYLPFKLLMH